MPSVLPWSSTPINFLRSHNPALRLRLAWGIERANETNNAMVCSAVVIVFPSGAFITTTPRMVAEGTSILSTPTPARPITRRLLAASNKSDVTFVSLRTISPSQSARAIANSRCDKPVRFSTLKEAARKGSRPLSLTSSATNIFTDMAVSVVQGYPQITQISQINKREAVAGHRGML